MSSPSANGLVGLTRRAEFLAAARERRASAPSLTLQARRRKPDQPLDVHAEPRAIRVGFTCSKKVGNAVARNRAKRRLREAARAILTTQGHPGWDYVLIGRPRITSERPFPDLLGDLQSALHKIHTSARPTPRHTQGAGDAAQTVAR